MTNVCGLMSKFGEFCHTVHTHSPDFVIATESKVTDAKMTTQETVITCYTAPIRQDRTANGGGVIVWFRQGMFFRQLDTISCNGPEVVWVVVDTKDHGKTGIFAVYRPDSCSGTDTGLIAYLDSKLEEVRHIADNVILAGDFNVHHFTWLGSTKTTLTGEALEDICALHCLEQHVRSLTRGDKFFLFFLFLYI